MAKPKMKSGSSRIVLGRKDAAVIVRADGSVELELPKQKDTDVVYPQSMLAVQLAVVLTDEIKRDRLFDFLAEEAPLAPAGEASEG